MTDGDRGRDPVTTERYRRDLGENVVALRFSLAYVAHGPALNAEGGLAQHSDVGVGDLHPEGFVHVALAILNSAEAPVR